MTTMTHEPPGGDFTVIRAAGAAVGALLSLVYVPPKNVREGVGRGVFSITSGYVFAFVAMEYFGWPETDRHWMAATVFVGGLSWLIAGVAVRILQSINKWPPWK